MNKDLEEKYLSVIEDNVNVGKSNVGVEFIILILGIAAIFGMVYIFADNISNLFIDKMSTETQMKIENSISSNASLDIDTNSKHVKKLNELRDKIISLDPELQNKSSFEIFEVKNKEINAFVIPNGTIYFTSGLLNKINDEETLAFILAHEMGHYAHRDHLKSISRDIIVYTLTSIFSNNQQNVNMTLNSISGLHALKYSRNQERNADRYANAVVYKLYGNNNGAVKFFEFLETEEKTPEFLQYFSTHPATRERIKMLKGRNF